MSPSRSPTTKSRRRASSSSSSNLSALLSTDDPSLAALQSQRLSELQSQFSTTSSGNTITANAPGHGAPVSLPESQAIQTTAAAPRSLLLFTHADMAACTTMQRHLDEISRCHAAVCCVVVDAASAGWLAERMGVRILPVLIGMLAGQEVGRVVGFEGLEGGVGAGCKAVERRVRGWKVVEEREGGGDEGEEEDEEEGEEERKKIQDRARGGRRGIRQGGRVRRRGDEDEDEDSDWD